MSELLTEPSRISRPIYQQDLETIAGIDQRILCGPASILHLAHEQGYDIEAEPFVQGLDWNYWHEKASGWSRAGLGQMLREQYGVASVSWWTASTGTTFSERDLTRMRGAGYVDSTEEIAFLREVVPGLPEGIEGVLALVGAGYSVETTVTAGFSANSTTHAIVLEQYDKEQGLVTVFDPDARNNQTDYSELFVREYLSPTGACTVVLPPQPR